MLKRNFFLKFSSLMLAGSMLVGAPVIIPVAQAATGGATAAQTLAINTWEPAKPTAGMGSIVLLNSFGSGAAPLTIDLQKGTLETERVDKKDTHEFIVSSEGLYTVPEATNGGMGHLQLNLAPGSYRYTASVPNIGSENGSFDVKADAVVGLTFYGGDAKTVVENHSQADKNSPDTTTSSVFTKLLVASEDLTAQARPGDVGKITSISAAPAASGNSSAAQPVAKVAADTGSVIFLNSFGNGTSLTINLQKGDLEAVRVDGQNTHEFIINSENLYTVPEATNGGMGHLQLTLAPGSYNYTASVPNVGTVNGSFDVTAGQIIGLTFYGGAARTIVHNHSEKDKNAPETTTSLVFTKLLVAPENLTAQVK